jgi:predicted AlkP superfamily phosphohydrolase/phosphomutase
MTYGARALALIALPLLLCRCGGPAPSKAAGRKLIVLGVDGMDPVFLERHWDSLPHLAKLRQQGGFQRLATVVPPQSPVAWSTFITGTDPGQHGIYDFIHRNPETRMPLSSMAEAAEGGRSLSLGPWVLPLSAGRVKSFRQGKAFWQTLSENGIPVTVLRMPTNFPPVDCEGQSLAGMGTPDLRGTFGTFTFFTDEEKETTRNVPGGKIVRVARANHRARLTLEGPENSLRKDRARTSIEIVADIDPKEPAALFRIGGERLLLRQGEWSPWVRVGFPMIPYFKDALGMIRIYARELHPGLKIYVSPVNIDPESPELPITDPPEYSRELASAVGRFYTQGMAEDTAALRQKVLTRAEYLSQTRLVANEHLRVFRHALDRFTDGLLFFHFFGVDQNSHMLWGRHDDELLESYKLADQALGWVMAKHADAAIVVMSDHGFSTFDRAVHVNTWLMREGFLTLDDPANASDEELFPHVDWSRTEAYSVGLNGIYLNRMGRESDGTVAQPDADYVLRKIADRLKAFRDPRDGKPVITTVYRPAEVYSKHDERTAPDLLIGYAPGYRSSWQTALGAVPKETVSDNSEGWIGDHCIAAEHVPGVLLANRKSKLADPRLEDMTVTILAHFGVARPAAMKGRNAFE